MFRFKLLIFLIKLMHSRRIKILVCVCLVSVLLFIAISPLAMIGIGTVTIVSCVVFQAFTTVILSKFCCQVKPCHLFISILFGGSVIDILIRICYFNDTLSTLPEFLGRVIAIVMGYIVFKLVSK